MLRTLALLVVAIVAGVAGYCLGFRQAWNLSVMADAPVRGALAVPLLDALDKNRIDPLRMQLESEIDSGLMWWARVEQSPLHGALNVLSGQELIPAQLRYVKRVAAYRKVHPSPLADVTFDDPDLAEQLAEGAKESNSAIAHMVEKYGQ